MEKEFVPYEIALALKELGFNEPSPIYYLDELHHTPITVTPFGHKYKLDSYPSNSDLCEGWVSTPLFSQAFRWFREEYNLLSEIGLRDREDLSTWKFEITIIGKYEMKHNSISYNTHEEAELACLIKLIEIIKEKYGTSVTTL